MSRNFIDLIIPRRGRVLGCRREECGKGAKERGSPCASPDALPLLRLETGQMTEW